MNAYEKGAAEQYVCLYCCLCVQGHALQAGGVILPHMVKYERNTFVPTKKYKYIKSSEEVIKNFISAFWKLYFYQHWNVDLEKWPCDMYIILSTVHNAAVAAWARFWSFS